MLSVKDDFSSLKKSDQIFECLCFLAEIKGHFDFNKESLIKEFGVDTSTDLMDNYLNRIEFYSNFLLGIMKDFREHELNELLKKIEYEKE